MFSLLFIFSWIALAFGYIHQTSLRRRLLLTAGLSVLLPLMLSAWITLLLSVVINPTVGAYSLLVPGLLILVFKVLRHPNQFRINRYLLSQWKVVLPLTVLVLLFCYLLFTHSAQVKGDGWYTGGSSWGDLPLHLTYLNYFARQDRLSLVSPIYAQQQTTYPFLIDWYASILMRLGASTQMAIFASQLQAIVAMLLLAFACIRAFDTRTNTLWFTLALFFFGGGLGWWFFWGDWQVSGLPFFTFIHHLPWQYTNMSERLIFFSTIIPDMLLPQRGFTVGLAVVLAEVILLKQLTINIDRWLLILSCVLIGLVPLFHVHSFLWIAGLWGIWFVWSFWHQPKQRKNLLRALGLVTVLITPQFWWLLSHGVGSQLLHWQPGWMITADQSLSALRFIAVFLRNFGLTAVLLVLLPLSITRVWRSDYRKAVLFSYSWLIFVVCLFISFQPWAYDNLKLMMLSYFFFSFFLGSLLADCWKRGLPLLVTITLLIGTASGILSVWRESLLSSRVASSDSVKMAQELQNSMNPQAVVLTGSTHNHPIPMLVGQPIVLGYGGWLWSHGIDATQTLSDVKKLYAGGEQTDFLLRKYAIRYVYISDLERSSMFINEAYWLARKHSVVYKKNDIVIYDVQTNAD